MSESTCTKEFHALVLVSCSNVVFSVIVVPSAEILDAGRLLGEKTVLNEFIAYLNFAEIMKDPGAMSAKTGLILSYALCGFANFLSIGIQIAGIGGIAPSRRKDIAALGLRAMIAGFMANNLRTAIAALLIFM
mgnify:CR=1 FL=1